MPGSAVLAPLRKGGPPRRAFVRGSTVPPVPSAPATPSTPSPADTATAYYTLLSWVSAGATKADIYLDTVNPPTTIVVPKYVGTSYVPTLLPATTYYWKIVAFNDGGSATGPAWSFTTPAATAKLFELAGTIINDDSRIGSVSIKDVLGSKANTGSLTVDTTAPNAGDAIKIGLGTLDDDALEFAGEVQRLDPTYQGRPANTQWLATLIDHTFRINRRRPFGAWVSTSATTIGRYLVAAFGNGFTSDHIQGDLPAISINFDGTADFMTCFRNLATAISDDTRVGKTKVDYARDVHLFLTPEDDDDAPSLDVSNEPQTVPSPIAFSVDHSQMRTRDYGKGHAENVPTDIAAGETIVPLPDAVMFTTTGGMAIVSTTSDGAQTTIITYAGVQLGGGGALLGPGAAPSVAPTLAAAVGSGLGAGIYQYAYTDVTASGESLPSPIGSVTTAAEIAGAAVAARPAPSSAPIGALGAASAGSVTPGNWQFKTTHVYSDGAESLPSAASNTLTDPTGTKQFDFSNVVVGDSRVSSRNVYACYASSGTPTWVSPFLMAQIANNTGTTVTRDFPFLGSISNTSPPSSAASYTSGANYVYVVDTTAYSSSGGSVRVGAQTFAYTGRSTTSSVGALTGVTGVTTTVNVGDASFIQGPYQQVSVSVIAAGVSPTTSRKLYRTVVGGSQLKLVATIADNTTTTYTDSTADGSLGANMPTGDTSGLTQPSGQVNAGSTSLLTSNGAPFRANGGWVSCGGGQTVRYTGVSTNTLTGVPASGAGAITTTLIYGSQVIPAPALTGVNHNNGLPLAIAKGSAVNIWVQRDDTDAQAALGSLELDADGNATDGIREYVITDERRGETSLAALCDADLAIFSRPIVSAQFYTRSIMRAGQNLHIDLPSFETYAGDYTIQSVDIAFDVPTAYPLRFVKASSVSFTLRDLIQRVTLG